MPSGISWASIAQPPLAPIGSAKRPWIGRKAHPAPARQTLAQPIQPGARYIGSPVGGALPGAACAMTAIHLRRITGLRPEIAGARPHLEVLKDALDVTTDDVE